MFFKDRGISHISYDTMKSIHFKFAYEHCFYFFSNVKVPAKLIMTCWSPLISTEQYPLRICLSYLVISVMNSIHFNPSNAEATFVKTQGCKDFWKTFKSCHFGIHWIAIIEYSQMSTNEPGFQSFYRFFVSFCNGKLATTSIRVEFLYGHFFFLIIDFQSIIGKFPS